MDIVVVDDSAKDRARIINDIKKYVKENTMLVHLAEYESGEDFLEKTKIAALEVVFLDIYLKGISGMEVATRIRQDNKDCQIVFVTTSAEFAIQSYDVRAFYYILKPYTYDDISRIISMLDKSQQKSARCIRVKTGREWRKILLSDIIYVDYSNHYVQIHTDSSVISTYMKFSEIEEMLLIYSEFMNCYRCIVINMDMVVKVEDLFFLMTNGEYVPINRKRVKEVKDSYVNYVFGIMEEESTMENR